MVAGVIGLVARPYWAGPPFVLDEYRALPIGLHAALNNREAVSIVASLFGHVRGVSVSASERQSL